MRRVATLASALVLVVGLGACSGFNDHRGIGDAPADQQGDQKVNVWPMPDRFANIAAICIGDNGVYVTTREAAPAVVPDDPECKENGALLPD